jgi:antitoxin (DNA-binding transcriptional repressor) of toxin-antitoxin stability system
VITKNGKQLVKVVALEAPTKAGARRLGFLEGQVTIPDDFDQMGASEMERSFNGEAE